MPEVKDIVCKFTIPAGQLGGKLSGGFLLESGAYADASAGPTLKPSGKLKVVVVHPDAATAPEKLTGIFVFSAAPMGGAVQAKASPFLSNRNRPLCLTTQEVARDSSSGAILYNFAPLAYQGGADGHYELTFVAENNAVTPPIQWSEDPEFDTGS